MANWQMLLAGILVSVALTDAYRFSRIEGLMPSFTDADYPPDDYIDDTDAVDTTGTIQELGFDFNVFGFVTDEVKIFDVGYILLLTSEVYEERTGDLTFFTLPSYPVVAPNWMESTLSTYHTAWRLVDESMAHRQHDLDRINKEVNQFQTWYPETWKATHALIVTWKIGDAAGAFNKFQAVLTSGVNTNSGDTEMYVLFLYEENFVPSQFGHVSALVNGNYDGSTVSVKLADLCEKDLIPIHLYSNYKCGTKGIYLFKMAAGTECSLAGDECEINYDNPQCMIPFHEPQDTCTETVYCLMNEDGTQVSMNFYFKHYVFDHLSALDYETFKGTGTDAEPEGVQVFVDDCQTTLANGGSAAAKDTFEFDVNIDPVDAVPPCGTVVDTTEHSIAYALTVYDPNNPDVDLDGKFILCGKCFYQDLPRQVTQSVLFNDISTVNVVRAPRYLSMKWIDRPTAIDGLELLSVKQGRDMWLMIAFITGLPFVRETDPFGVRVDHCRISNNENFHEYSDDQIGNPDDRAEDIFVAGCVNQPDDKSFYFENGFTVDPNFDTIGGEWRIVAGKMEAVAFNTPSKKLWTMCTIRFCTRTTNTYCHSTCTVAGRTRRSVEVNTTATGTETLIVELDIEKNDESQQPTGEQVGTDDDCVSQTTAIITIVILIVITLIALAAAIAIFLMLQKRNKLRRKM